jgi:prolyl oligopeptidase
MSRSTPPLALSAGLVMLGAALGGPPPTAPGVPPLPDTPRRPVTREFHGTAVTDPYAWLDNGADAAVRAWTEQQNRHTRAVLDHYPGLSAIRERLRELLTGVTTDYGALRYQGGKLFAMKFQPPKEQAFLVTLASPFDTGSERVVLDPNRIRGKGPVGIDFYVPSPDAKLVAVSLSEGGSEDGTVHVYEVASGKELADVVPRVQYPTAGGSLAWNADGSGFYYTRYPHEGERPKGDLPFYQQVWFHRLGTPAGADVHSLGKDFPRYKDFPRIAEIVLDRSPDGRHVLATVENGDGGEYMHYLLGPGGKWTQLTAFPDQVTAAVFGPDDHLYLVSRQGAPRGKLLRVPLADPRLAAATTVVPEGDAAIQAFRITNNAFAANFVVTAGRVYLVDSEGGPSRIRVFGHDGKAYGTVPILAVSAVLAVAGGKGDELLFRNTSFLEPRAWYRYDPAAGRVERSALYATSPADFHDCEVVREFATSKDGTRVPLSIVCRKGTPRNGRNPTLLTGYGGFGISLAPSFALAQRVWLEQGGVFAVANLRGGAEYGEAWHRAGSGTNKQNVFDDFAACARHLIAREYTAPDRLAVEGGSNGGLLVGAALTQHPELYRAAVARIGVFDMLAENRHANGEFIAAEYGTVKDPEQFKAIYAYSPYHHVKDGTAYPAVFLQAGANDGRADPAHSRKMAARLQAAAAPGRSVLLQINADSGHGASSLSQAVDQQADVYAFLFGQLAVDYRAAAR